MSDETRDLPPDPSADETPTRSDLPIPAGPDGEPTISSSDATERFQSIAGYRIIRKLGEGGMGIVYEAEQLDPKRLVALKVIRGGAQVDDYKIKLFQREIHTLALLKHPGIAAIYDAGRTEEGQHFFAMELVRGVPLDEYVRAHRDDGDDPRARIKFRLDLFMKICSAINYAHQRGVIHRDLKPSNILVVPVGGDGGSPEVEIKVLDFGLARITDSDVEAATVLTQLGQILGTFAYMSPEQARGIPDEIDLRTDVYSLGVILYQLLTDRLPYNVAGSAIHEAVRTICEEIPVRPGTVSRALSGDLETITLKALDKTVDGRYQSVLALSEDIERFLTNQPILARPPSTIYQLKKLMVRHKGAFAVASTFLILLAAFAVTMSAMFGIQRRERLRADAEKEKAQQINVFLQDMLSSVDPEQALGREVTVREVLDEASEGVHTGLAEQPDVQAAVRSTIGLTYMALGLYDSAEEHLRQSLETRRRVFGKDHPEVASSLNDLAGLLYEKGEYEAAEPLFREALEMNRRFGEKEYPEVARILNNLALLLRSQGKHSEAEPLLREAIDLRIGLYGPEHPEVAAGLSNLAGIVRADGRYAEAESLYRSTLELRRATLDEDHPDIALTLNGLATVLLSQGKFEEAEPLLRESLRLSEKTLGKEHPSVARTLTNLAHALSKLSKFEEAESCYREALDIYKGIAGEEHPVIASCLNNIGGLLLQQGKPSEAESLYRQALAMRHKLLGEEHPDVAMSLNNLALALQDQGRLTEAELLYRQALDMRRKLLGDTHPHLASSLLGLGTVLNERGRPEAAEPILREAIEIYRSSESGQSWSVAYAENSLGHCLAMQRRFDEAESLIVRSVPEVVSASAAAMMKKREVLEHAIAFYEATSRPDLAAPYRQDLGRLEE